MYGMVNPFGCFISTSALRQGYPQPTAVYVSPLQRTLQTAAILFPEHPGIHVTRWDGWGEAVQKIAKLTHVTCLACFKDNSTFDLSSGRSGTGAKSSKRGPWGVAILSGLLAIAMITDFSSKPLLFVGASHLVPLVFAG